MNLSFFSFCYSSKPAEIFNFREAGFLKQTFFCTIGSKWQCNSYSFKRVSPLRLLEN